MERVLTRAHDHDEPEDADPRLRLPPTSHLPGEDGRPAKETGCDLELQLAHGFRERQREDERGRLAGQHRPSGVLAATVRAVEDPLHLAPTVRSVHQRLNR